ncbi:MAG: hypothetical protein J6T60_08030 [Bacteroidales bacterium]|nr:hypothetical protein [Bacteroidales bacterium]
MAAKDYSRRSNKDVFLGDETPTTPYTPSENSDTANDDTEDDFDVEKFIRENDSNITTTVTAKIVTHILVIVLMFLLWRWSKIDLVFFCIIAFWVFYFIISIVGKFFSASYKNYIEKAIKSFKKIKLYRHEIEGGAAWGKMISCPGEAHTKDLTRIEIDDKIVKALDLDLFLDMGRYGTIKYFIGDYYEVSLGDKSFANNVLLVKGDIKHVKKRVYTFQHEGYTIYAYNEGYINDSDMNRVYALAEKLHNSLSDKQFIINFSGDKIMFMMPTKIKDNFHYEKFDYAIEDRLRRDITALKHRIQIAEILASA